MKTITSNKKPTLNTASIQQTLEKAKDLLEESFEEN